MEFDNSRTINEDDNTDLNNVDIKEIIFNYLSYWKWFILCILVSLAVSFYKLNFKRSLYQATATIKLKDEKGGGNSTLDIFEDLGMINASSAKIVDEIEILKSRSLLKEVVKSLI